MPRAAIATGMVDFVLPVVDMPQRWSSCGATCAQIRLPAEIRRRRRRGGDCPNARRIAARRPRKRCSDVMKPAAQHTGHDFKHYKRATVLRRIERRCRCGPARPARLPRLPAAEQSEAKRALLLQDMLISVTNFFRDREAFEALQREVIPAVRGQGAATRCASGWPAAPPARKPIRWRCCCAIRRADSTAPPFQVFASDIDERRHRHRRAPAPTRRDRHRHRPTRLRQHFVRTGDRLPRPQGDARPHAVRLAQRAARSAVLAAGPGLLPQPADLPGPPCPGRRAGDVPLRAEAGRHAVPGRSESAEASGDFFTRSTRRTASSASRLRRRPWLWAAACRRCRRPCSNARATGRGPADRRPQPVERRNPPPLARRTAAAQRAGRRACEHPAPVAERGPVHGAPGRRALDEPAGKRLPRAAAGAAHGHLQRRADRPAGRGAQRAFRARRPAARGAPLGTPVQVGRWRRAGAGGLRGGGRHRRARPGPARRAGRARTGGAPGAREPAAQGRCRKPSSIPRCRPRS
jgi:hypothetical protein